MDAAGYGKHITLTDGHLQEAMEILDMGVHETISEGCALLCADTQLMLAEHQLQDARRKLQARMRHLQWEEENV